MASGSIKKVSTISGTVSGTSTKTATIASGGVTDHNKLKNRDADDQHPISAITDLQSILDDKLDSSTALPLIEEATSGKAKGLYYDSDKLLSKKSYWYLTSEIDSDTGLGIIGSVNKTKKYGYEYVISGPYDLGSGGSGGGGSSVTTIKLTTTNPNTGESMWHSTVAYGQSCRVGIYWSSTKDDESTGSGTIYVSVNGTTVINKVNAQGVVYFELSEYLILGSNKITFKVVDAYNGSKTLIGTINAVSVSLTSKFDNTKAFEVTGNVLFDYTPYGSLSKVMHFEWDGTEIGTQTVTESGTDQQFEINKKYLSHGDHTLKAYFTCTIDGNEVSSNELFYDLICYKSGDTTPIIASDFNDLEQEQYIAFNIPYRVFIAGSNYTTVVFTVDGETYETHTDVPCTTGTEADPQGYKYDGTGEEGETWPQEKTLALICGTTKKEFKVTIAESQVKVTPVTTGLKLQLSSYGKSNDTEAKTQWIDSVGKVSCTLTDFNWSSDGWLKDSDGNTVLRVAGDARVEIPYKLFSNEPVELGKTIELEFATHNIHSYSTKILQCLNLAETIGSSVSMSGEDTRTKKFVIDKVDNDVFKEKVGSGNFATYVFSVTKAAVTSDDAQFTLYVDSIVKGIVNPEDYGITTKQNDLDPTSTEETDFYQVGDRIIVTYAEVGRGLYVTPQLASLQSQQSSISTQYKEDDHVKLTFVIEKLSRGTRLIWMYINGIASGVTQYPEDDVFKQSDPQYITIGSNDATMDIYTIRIYDNDLIRRQVVSNWIADTRDGELKATRYYNNDNYDETGKLVIDKLPSKTPYIIFSNLQDNKLPEYKGDKRTGDINFTYPLNHDRNFHTEGAQFNVQGTSSQYYYKKNLKTKFNNTVYIGEDEEESPYGDKQRKYPLTPDAIPARTFTLKADVASSEGANNVEMVRYFEDTKNWWTPPELYVDPVSGEDHKDSIRVGIDGFPMVAFFNDGTDTSFYAKMNFNNDKGTEDVYGFSSALNADGSVDFDHTDESWEFLMNNSDLVLFRSDNLTNWAVNFESRFPETIGDDEHNYGTRTGELDRLQELMTWVVSTNREAATNEVFAERKTFGEYGTSYQYKRDDQGNIVYEYDEELKQNVPVVIEVKGAQIYYDADTEDYRLAKFRNELEDHFNLQSCLFFYLFTELFLLVDNRAKNATLAYYYSRTEGDGGDRWFWIPYDMDTALGINNEGLLVFDYNAEDTDLVNGAYVYNGQRSVFWNNMRDAFPDELKELYVDLRAGNAGGNVSWKYEDSTNSGIPGIEDRFETHQSYWSENIFNEDSYEKCIVPLEQSNDATYLGMLQGSKLEQRRWWLSNRFKYIDSKYRTGDAKGTTIMLRAYQRPKDGEGFNIVPYSSCYLTAIYDQEVNYVQQRAEKDKTYTIDPPSDWDPKGTDAVVALYSADLIKDIGDIAGYYVGYADFSKATKLEKLKVGDDGTKYPNYKNEKLETLNIGANDMLKSLDVRNCPNLEQAINVSECLNLEEIYLEGTSIKGITLPDGGTLKTLHLPGTLTNLTIRNQPLLKDFSLAGSASITRLYLENIPSEAIDSYNFVKQMPEKSYVKLIGINETFEKAVSTDASEKTISKFYDILDTMLPIDEGFTKAQVSGTINIDTIYWADKDALTKRYPEIKIVANHIICAVKFFNETAQLGETQYLDHGEDAVAPATPSKAPDQQYYYTFAGWDTDYTNVQSDLNIHALYDSHLQQYKVVFHLQTTRLDPIPTQTIYYGSTAVKPIDPYIEGAEFLGWCLDKAGTTAFTFDTPILKDTDLYAKWKDDSDPTFADVKRIAYNKIQFTLEDNIAITGYAVTTTDETPSEWIEIDPDTSYTNTYEITSAGNYWVWGEDESGRTIKSNKFIARDITITDLDYFTVIPKESETTVDDFALDGTELIIYATVDKHYENAVAHINGIDFEVNSGETRRILMTVVEDITATVECTPKSYIVEFNTDGKGTVPSTQTIVYNHLATRPANQYYNKEIISGWYTTSTYDEGTEWNFGLDPVDRDLLLYAQWVPYKDPTQITVKVEENQTVFVYFTQDTAHGAEISWGDEDDHRFVSDSTLHGAASLYHTYATAGTYVIKFYTAIGSTALGGGNTNYPLVSPAKVITDIVFAYNVDCTNDYALIGAVNLTKLIFTPYMTAIAKGMCRDCTGLTTIDPSTAKISEIGEQAFYGCSSITSLNWIPTTVSKLCTAAFMGCSSLSDVQLGENIKEIGETCFENCTALTEIELPKSITSIEAETFYNTGLTSFTADTQITYIGRHAFENCHALTQLNLLNPDLIIGNEGMCAQCELLRTAGPINADGTYKYNINFAWTTALPEYALYMDNMFNNNLSTVVLPSKLESIGEKALHGLGFTTITLPSTLISIGAECFGASRFLNKISIPASVKVLGRAAFTSCTNLQTVNIYANVLAIDASGTKVNYVSDSWFYGATGAVVFGTYVTKDETYEYFGTKWLYCNDDTEIEYYQL